MKSKIQKISSYMSSMIMPCVSILIAWGLLTAMFIGKIDPKTNTWSKTGWFNSQALASLISPTIKWLIPILIGFMAGYSFDKLRGGVLGSFVILISIVGTDYIWLVWKKDWTLGSKSQTLEKIGSPNSIFGAMILSPIFVYLFKRIESLWIKKIPTGFEMLVNNFSLAFYAIIITFIIFFTWGFVMYGISFIMISIISLFSDYPFLFPFIAIFSEPLRAMFLNNALNWGVMIPIGMFEVESNEYSPFFLVGGNPGQGFGLLMAYAIWDKKRRYEASSSSVIQLLGGIHEVHYVFILASPIMVLATISGSFSSLLFIKLFNGGAIGPISPGSLISVILMSKNKVLINILGVLIGIVVSFVVASCILIFKRNKIQKPVINQNTKDNIVFSKNKTLKLMVVCDAGMGSSVMAASIIRRFCQKNNLNIEVSNCAIKNLTNDFDIIVTQKVFEKIVKEKTPTSYLYTVEHFLGNNIYDELYSKLLKTKDNKN